MKYALHMKFVLRQMKCTAVHWGFILFHIEQSEIFHNVHCTYFIFCVSQNISFQNRFTKR